VNWKDLQLAILGHVLPAEGEVPEWIQLAPEGAVRLEDEEDLYITEEGAATLIAAWKDLGHKVVFDYEHQTLKDVEAPAAGWFEDLEWRGPGKEGGLWAKIDWTERAARRIEAKEYRYHSPVFLHGKTDRVVRYLVNAALTNQPKMKDVRALAAKMDVAALAAKHIHLNQGEEDMKFSEEAAKALGLDATAKEEDVLKALKDLAASHKEKDTELTALKAKVGDSGKDVGLSPIVLKALGLADGASDEDAEKAIKALQASDKAAGSLGESVAALKAELAKMKADDLVSLALKDGRLSPQERDAWGSELAEANPKQFEAIVLSRQPGSAVPLEELSLKADPKATGSTIPDDVQMSVNKQLGISDETFKKYGPKAKEG
jgi:phage I-like protein